MQIYKTTNLVNGKIYVGKNGTDCPTYLGSGTVLYKAIKKYGKQFFRKDILDTASSEAELNSRERYWIAIYKSFLPIEQMYNILSGGEGTTSEEQREIAKRMGPEKLSQRAIKVALTLGKEGLSARSKQVAKNRDNSALIRKGIVTMGIEGLKRKARKAIETQGPEAISERIRKANHTRYHTNRSIVSLNCQYCCA